MTTGQPKPSNDVCKSNASVSSQKQRETKKRCYESLPLNNKLSKVRTDDVTQSDSLIERVPFRTLQSNGSQIAQPLTGDTTPTMRHLSVHQTNNVLTSKASTSVEKGKERNRPFHASNKENYKVSNVGGGDETTQIPPHCPNDASTANASTFAEKRKEINKRYYAARKEQTKASKLGSVNVSTPTSTLPSQTNRVVTETSRGIRIQPRTLFPQLSNVIGQPSSRDENMEQDLTNTQVPLHCPNDASTPDSSTLLAEKRKEQNKRYYAARKEKNKASKVGGGDVSTPTSTLPAQTNRVLTEISRGIRIQPRTLFPQLSNVIGQPSSRDENMEQDLTNTQVPLHCPNDVSTPDASTLAEK